MEAFRPDVVAHPPAAVLGGLTPPEPPVPVECWTPSANLIAGLCDAGLVGEWPPTESVDLTVWKRQPKRIIRQVSQATH